MRGILVSVPGQALDQSLGGASSVKNGQNRAKLTQAIPGWMLAAEPSWTKGRQGIADRQRRRS